MPRVNTWEPQGVVKRFWGFLSGAELADSVDEIAAHPAFDDLRFIINDWSDVTGHDIDEASIERVAATRIGSSSTHSDFRVIVVTTDPVLTRLADVEANPLLRGSHQTLAFTTLASARAWLKANPMPVTIRRRLRM